MLPHRETHTTSNFEMICFCRDLGDDDDAEDEEMMMMRDSEGVMMKDMKKR